MGLDLVEFVMAVEDAFGIEISNDDASRMRTPRDVADFVERNVQQVDDTVCLTQRAFYRLRSAAAAAAGMSRAQIRPDTPWTEVFPRSRLAKEWAGIKDAVGAETWPGTPTTFSVFATTHTVGETATFLCARTPGLLKHPEGGWSRVQIECVVQALMQEEFGIKAFGWDDEFVRDLHLD